jgi:hypothetical protein
MRKTSLILTIILLCFGIFLSAMARKPGTPYSADSLKLKLMEPIKQDLQINCTGLDGRIYFIDDVSLNKNDILNKKLCFILSSDFIFSDITMDGKNVPLMTYKGCAPQDFYPTMEMDTYKKIQNKTRIYELVFDNVDILPENVNVRIKYHIFSRPDSLFVFKYKNNTLYMNGSYFWYPRNLNRDENLNLIVKTTDQTAFSLDGRAINYIMPQNYLKEYKLDLIDSKEKPATIIFQKKS